MNETNARPMRSALYLPASNTRAIEKSRSLPADVLIFDLEDAVAPQAKASARSNLAPVFAQASTPREALQVIRVNDVHSSFIDDDLSTVASCRPDAVLLPKVGSAADLAAYAAKAAASGVDPAIPVWCMIESVEALARLDEIGEAGRRGPARVECWVVGTNDIVRETGVSADRNRLYLLPWLMNIVLVAKRNKLALLDGVWNDFKDLQGFGEETVQARDMGFDGKTLIHPSQIGPANNAFAPAPETVEAAQAIATAFADPANADKGVINLNGQMVELLHLAMARKTLQLDAAIRARRARPESAGE
jgi:citrate lyase subunit beta/citryl-CoA lyase